MEVTNTTIRPSDLIEIPATTYFKIRNDGELVDSYPSENSVNRYLSFYKKDPRIFFKMAKQNTPSISWITTIDRRIFTHSIGTFDSHYQSLDETIFDDEKYKPSIHPILHRYQYNQSSPSKDTALLFIHGFAESRFLIHEHSYFRLFNRKFNSDIFALELPYHQQRAPLDSPFSGAYFLNGNPVRMVEAIRQSLFELLTIIQHLKQTYSRVIVFGVSLGGHLAALLSQLVENIELVIAQSSPFLFKLSSKTNIVPLATKTIKSYQKDKVTSFYKLLYPTNLKYFAPFTTNKKTILIAGKFDRIVPYADSKKLSIMIKKPIIAYNGGHLTILPFLNTILKKVEKYLTL